MSPQTKKKALAKLAAFQIGLGYPDSWIDYSTLEVVRGDALGTCAAEASTRSRNLARLRQPSNRDRLAVGSADRPAR